jgi:hypothetical protein
MINDRPPRDGPSPAEPLENVTGDDFARDIHSACQNEDATGMDFPGEGFSQSSPPTFQQHSPFMNTSGPDPSSSGTGTITNAVFSADTSLANADL